MSSAWSLLAGCDKMFFLSLAKNFFEVNIINTVLCYIAKKKMTFAGLKVSLQEVRDVPTSEILLGHAFKQLST